jgi:hypothetical protein
MAASLAVNFLPIFSDEKKVEVSLQDDQAVIKLSTWADDLGWCGQKTMSLDAAMLEELHRVIAAARIRLSRQKIDNQEAEVETTSANAKVLEFPRVS